MSKAITITEEDFAGAIEKACDQAMKEMGHEGWSVVLAGMAFASQVKEFFI